MCRFAFRNASLSNGNSVLQTGRFINVGSNVRTASGLHEDEDEVNRSSQKDKVVPQHGQTSGVENYVAPKCDVSSLVLLSNTTAGLMKPLQNGSVL